MDNKNLTVVVVNDFDYVQGGATKVALDTAQILYDNNIDVIYFSAVHKENDYKFKQISTNQKECLSDGVKGALRGLYNFKAAKEFGKLLDTLDSKNTIIHIHGWTKALSSSIFRIASKKKFKTVLTLHDYFAVCPNGGFFNYKKCEICKKKALSFDCIKTNCDSRNYFFKLYRVVRQIIQKNNMKNLENVISISNFSENILKSKFNKKLSFYKINNPIDIVKKERAVAEKNEYYIYVGRVSKEKGVDIFCEAVNELKVNAVVAGDGEQLEYLKNKYKDSNINFVGWQDKNNLNKYLKKTKCLVFPSKWYETAGLTILEAISNGVPCIVSKVTAGSEFIINQKNGILFDGSVKDLVCVLKKYEIDNIKEKSEFAYENYWKNPYNDEMYLSKILNCYKNLK